MSQNIRQADDILFHSVKSERKQVSEIVRKHFLGIHMRLCAQSLHHAPYICAVHRLSRAGDKYRPGGKSLFFTKLQQKPTQFPWQDHHPHLSLIGYLHLSCLQRFDRYEAMFTHPDAGTANCL